MAQRQRFLDKVYGVGDADEARDLYRDWAQAYDEEMRLNDYCSPGRVARAMADHAADKSLPLLDLGCGTGLSGEALREAGFAVIDGTDFSDEMLGVAETKQVYRKLFVGDAREPVPAQPGDYANFTAVGVFSPGHVPPNLIGKVLALLSPGGCFGFTLNDHAIEEEVYEATLRASVERGEATVAFRQYGDHLPKAGLKSMVYVLRKS